MMDTAPTWLIWVLFGALISGRVLWWWINRPNRSPWSALPSEADPA